VGQAAALQIGTEPFPGFHLRRFLGRGSFGEFWQVEAPDQTASVLKFLPCDCRAKTPQETRSLQAIRHPFHLNLVRVHNPWRAPGYLVLAMELADGTFQAAFARPLCREYVGALLNQAAAALDFLNINDQEFETLCSSAWA
jgi:serine/threonine protein kinase